MTSDPLNTPFARAARDADVLLDPRWEAFAAGRLGADEVEALLRAAREAGLDDEAIAALGPRPEGHDDALADALIDGMRQGAPAPAITPSAAPVIALPSARVANDATRAAPQGSNAPRRTARWPWAAATAFAVAAAALLILRPFAPAPLPSYAMLVEGGVKPSRADPPTPGGAPRFGPSSRLTITLRPAKDAAGAIGAATFLVTNGAAARIDARAQIQIAAGGAVRIEGDAAALFAGVPAGSHEIVVAVGRPDRLPDAAHLDAPPGDRPDFVLLRQPIAWEPAPTP